MLRQMLISPANAYFANPIENGPRFQFSEMYTGKGLEALLKVAHGLREAAQGWKDDDITKEARLSPVVAMHDERVLKVYDNAQHRDSQMHARGRERIDLEKRRWGGDHHGDDTSRLSMVQLQSAIKRLPSHHAKADLSPSARNYPW